MHSELGQTNVDGWHGHLGVGDRAEGGATRQVGTVVVGLCLDTSLPTNLREDCVGDAVGGVALGGVELYYHTATEQGCVLWVGHLGVVGVLGMCVVGTNHKTAR